jgi:excisionase family DNA binding protein
MESMMTVRQVAELLGVHENWVYDQAASGGLPSYKIGGSRRFDPDELRGWIAQHHQPDNGRQPRRPSARRATAASPARRRAQDEERQSAERSTRSGRRRTGTAARGSEEAQPRLFEI